MKDPYVGLRPFEKKENLLFFGRRDQVTALLQNLHQFRFLAVVGGSGSPKVSDSMSSQATFIPSVAMTRMIPSLG